MEELQPELQSDLESPRRSARRRTSQQPQSKMTDRAFLVAVGALVAIALLVIGGDALLSAGRVHHGVSVGNVDLGGLRRDQALVAAKARLTVPGPVKVRGGKHTWTIEATQVGAVVDPEAAVAEAYAYGRSGSLSHRLGQRLGAWFRSVQLPVAVSFDEEKFGSVLSGLDDELGRPAREASVKVVGTDVELVSAKDGVGVVTAQAHRDIARAFAQPHPALVKLKLAAKHPAVTDEDAQSALDEAEAMLSGAVTLTYGSKSWTLEPERIAPMIAFRPESLPASASTDASSVPLEAYIVADEVSSTVGPLVKGIGRAAKDATFKAAGGSVTIVPSEVGTAVDMPALAKTLTNTLRDPDTRSVPLRLRKVQPAVTTAKARGMGIKQRISTFTTEYAPNNAPRVNNIHTLAKALDGTLIAPGGVFSFNGTVGPRTAEKGYQEAPAIVNGELVPQLGGGVCQVGTTTFNAAFFSGLPIVERRNHSFYISHYPRGRDATVSWGGPDLKFKNTTKSWILIRADFTASSVTISLYGTSPGYDVSYTTGPWSDAKPFSTKEVKDSTLPKGTRVVEDPGVVGGKIVVTRTVRKGGKVVSTDTFTSIYKSKEQVVRVGTKATKD